MLLGWETKSLKQLTGFSTDRIQIVFIHLLVQGCQSFVIFIGFCSDNFFLCGVGQFVAGKYVVVRG